MFHEGVGTVGFLGVNVRDPCGAAIFTAQTALLWRSFSTELFFVCVRKFPRIQLNETLRLALTLCQRTYKRCPTNRLTRTD